MVGLGRSGDSYGTRLSEERAPVSLWSCSFTSQMAASVPGRFFEARFLSGVENGRFFVDRA